MKNEEKTPGRSKNVDVAGGNGSLESSIKKECLEIHRDPRGAGGPIDRATAKQRFDAFDDASIPERVDAHIFGLDKVREFLNKIYDYNETYPECSPITGIKVYRCLNDDRVDWPDKNDIFIVPLCQDGSEPIPINLVDDIILGDPRPCPNMCKFI
ncbi:hypothetical protein GCM10009122_48130 [Fulvivirga kasyanovii]|uniref:hypothetical protein n=1 Tax=Fulvivirga kasyanovii TaxID=396812 RepID=UPI0031D05734